MSQRDLCAMIYYYPQAHKSNVGDLTSYSLDLGSSDFKLSLYGMQCVRELLFRFQPFMHYGCFYGPAPSFVGFTIRSDFSNALIKRFDKLLWEPRVLRRLPTTKSELRACSAYFYAAEPREAMA